MTTFRKNTDTNSDKIDNSLMNNGLNQGTNGDRMPLKQRLNYLNQINFKIFREVEDMLVKAIQEENVCQTTIEIDNSHAFVIKQLEREGLKVNILQRGPEKTKIDVNWV